MHARVDQLLDCMDILYPCLVNFVRYCTIITIFELEKSAVSGYLRRIFPQKKPHRQLKVCVQVLGVNTDT
jgi:hypothetical protein